MRTTTPSDLSDTRCSRVLNLDPCHMPSIHRSCISSDEEEPITGRARIMQRHDAGSVRHIRAQILRLERVVGGQQCGEALEVDRLHMEFMKGLERREAPGKCPLFLSNLLAAGREPTGPEFPGSRRMERKRHQVSQDARSQRRSGVRWSWRCAESVMCSRRCSPWSCSRQISDKEKCRDSNHRVFFAPTEGCFIPSNRARSKTGEAHDTISLDSKRCLWMEPVFERLQRQQPQDKPLLNLNYAEYLVLLRRAAANL